MSKIVMRKIQLPSLNMEGYILCITFNLFYTDVFKMGIVHVCAAIKI